MNCYYYFKKLTCCLILFCGIGIVTLQQNLYGKEKPLLFLENTGQISDQYGKLRADIDFKATTSGLSVYVGSGKLHYQWAQVASPVSLASFHDDPASQVSFDINTYRMDVELIGANPDAKVIREDMHQYHERYYKLGIGTQGLLARSCKKITYENIYPGIDWELYARNDEVEYRFVVHPGGKVSDIRIQYSGADQVNINRDGSLTSTNPFGYLTERAPYSFDEQGQEVASSFSLEGYILSFTVGKYKGTLTIDPTLSWGTYLGGQGGTFDIACDVIYDRKNRNGVYVAGMTTSTNIATTGAYQNVMAGLGDAYVAKLDETSMVQWSTYYGGTSTDGQGSNMICDTSGAIYITGITHSETGIATPGSFQPTITANGTSAVGNESDLYLAKFDSMGMLIWGTYYGGTNYADITTDGYHVYLFGTTDDTVNIATPGAYQAQLNNTNAISGFVDAFIAKFDGDGNRVWGTYYGGASHDWSSGGIAYDKAGYLYIGGDTYSPDLASPGAFQGTIAGLSDVYIVKFDTSGNFIWSTYYGGTEDEMPYALICDDSSNVYLTGGTSSPSGMTTAGAQQASLAGGDDIFVAKFDAAGNRVWGTYCGGAADEIISRVMYDGGKLYLSASTLSTSGIATEGAYQTTNTNANGLFGNVFLMAYTPAGEKEWGTYYGGAGGEGVGNITFDPKGYIYMSGTSASYSGVATPGSWEDENLGFLTSFVAKFCLAPAPEAIAISGSDTVCRNSAATYAVEDITDADGYIWTLPEGWAGSSDENSIDVTTTTAGGAVSVRVVRCGDTSAAKVLDVYVLPAAPAVITVNGFVLGTVETYTSYQWLLNGIVIDGATGPTYTVTENGDYTVITINALGCSDTSAAYTVTNVTGIEDSPLAANIRIYPNPATHLVYIVAATPVSVIISSIDGKQLLHKDAAQVIDISSLPQGVYMLQVLDKDARVIKTEKLIKL